MALLASLACLSVILSLCISQLVTRERQKLEDEIETNKNAQNTVNKAVRNLNKVRRAIFILLVACSF